MGCQFTVQVLHAEHKFMLDHARLQRISRYAVPRPMARIPATRAESERMEGGRVRCRYSLTWWGTCVNGRAKAGCESIDLGAGAIRIG